jgi:hypothetical protein
MERHEESVINGSQTPQMQNKVLNLTRQKSEPRSMPAVHTSEEKPPGYIEHPCNFNQND